jgi:dienelactone hydrolase
LYKGLPEFSGNCCVTNSEDEQMFLGRTAIAFAVLLTATQANAQFAVMQEIAIESSTPSPDDFLKGKPGEPVLIAGHLRLPQGGPPGQVAPKQPVVVLMHGAGGQAPWNGYIHEWSRVMNEAGIGTFNVDSYSGRGIFDVKSLAKLPALVRVMDAYAALKALSKHPSIDAGKIVVMGFSHGGPAALYSNVARFQKMYGNGLKFAGNVSVYGLCGIKYREDEDVVSPLLILHGTDEDWVPYAPCDDYATRLGKAGKDVRIIGYPNSFHVFDSPAAGEVKKIKFNTSAGCMQEESDGGIVMRDTHKPLEATNSCYKPEVTMGYNAETAKKAHADALAWLKEKVLK